MQITVFAQKGAQAKSTTSVNIMAAMQEIVNDRFFRLVDLDDQQRDSTRFSGGMPGVEFSQELRARDQRYLTVVDTPPQVNETTMGALISSDIILLPCIPETLSLEALARTFQTLRLVYQQNPAIVARVLFVRTDNTQHTQGIITCAKALGEWPALDIRIPQRKAEFEKAAEAKLPVITERSKGAGANAYREVAKKVRELYLEKK